MTTMGDQVGINFYCHDYQYGGEQSLPLTINAGDGLWGGLGIIITFTDTHVEGNIVSTSTNVFDFYCTH